MAAKSKQTSTKSVKWINAGGSGKMHTAQQPSKGSKVSVPNWNQSVSPSNSFMKAKKV